MAYARSILISLVWIILTSVVGVQSSKAQGSSLPVMVLEITNTNNTISRTRLTSPRPQSQILTVGTVLDKDDYLDIPSGNEVVIMCDNGYRKIIETGEVSCEDAVDSGTSIFLWGKIAIAGDFRPGIIPQIMTPRNSRLTRLPKTIQWILPHVDGEVKYNVEISSGLTSVWETKDLANTWVDFPSAEIPMPANNQKVSYQVKVFVIPDPKLETPVGDSDTVSFCFVGNQVTDAIQSQLAAPTSAYPASKIGQAARDYLQAYLLYQAGLYNDALDLMLKNSPLPIDKLNQPLNNTFASVTELTHSPSYYILLGDIFQAMILKTQAVDAYSRAEELATASGDQLTLAAIKIRIADSKKGFLFKADFTEEIQNYYKEAESIYLQLGYPEKAKSTAQWADQEFNPNAYPSICSS